MALIRKGGGRKAVAQGGAGAAPGGQVGPGGPDIHEISISESAGISEEEQREILTQINGIAEKNRLALSFEGEGSNRSFKAQKNGGLFPALVNAFAALMLVGGFFGLYALQRGADTSAREGTRVFNNAERALIGEIRRETSENLAAQDREISEILESIAQADAQLQRFAFARTMTEEQQGDMARILAEQSERREALAAAQQERSRILYEARAEESDLQVRRDVRSRELAEAEARGEAPPQRGGGRGERSAGEEEDLMLWRADRNRERSETGRAREEGQPPRGGGGGRGRDGLGDGDGAGIAPAAFGAFGIEGFGIEDIGGISAIDAFGAIGAFGGASAFDELAGLAEARRRLAAEDSLMSSWEMGGTAARRIDELEGLLGALQDAMGMDRNIPFEFLLGNVLRLADAEGNDP